MLNNIKFIFKENQVEMASGIATASYFVLSGTCVGILIIHLILTGIKLPGIDKLLERLERMGVIPGEGSMYYALGVLFTLGLLRDNSVAAISVILILAIGDSLATYR
jgi:dolichol kinase